MIVLTSRAARVTRTLLELGGKPITARELAARVGAGERAVRYDLGSIGLWLSARRLRLCRKPRVGIWVEGSPGARAAALAELEGVGQAATRVVVSPEDRQWLILGWVLSSGEPVGVRFLARILGVGERTVYYDVARLRAWLRHIGLDLVCRRRRLSVAGDEMRCRGLMLEFLEGSGVHVGAGRRAMAGTEPDAALGALEPLLKQIGGGAALRKVGGIIATAERLFRLTLSDNVRAALSAHILVVLTRVKQGRFVRTAPEQLARLRHRPEWVVAQWIAAALEEAFSVILPEEETACLALYLGPAMVQGPAVPGVPALVVSQEALGWCARIIAEEAGRQLGVDLMDDVQLRAGLVGHLYASLEKIQAGLPTRNPLLGEVRRRFPLIYRAASRAAERVGKALQVEIPEEEVGWIALHLGAALERLAQRRRSWTGVVVCPSGLGSSLMLQARLQSEFPDAVLTTMAAVDEDMVWEEARRIRADVVVSTVPLTEGPVPVVVVSPFLTSRDVGRLSNVLYAHRTLDEEELLRECRAKCARGAQLEEGNFVRLGDVVRSDLIRVDVPVATPEDAIAAAGELLQGAGVVTCEYVQAMVDLYRRFGPYFVVLPGVAIPHAAPEKGALGAGMSVITLGRPVNFGASDRDPVDVVIALSCPVPAVAFAMVQELVNCLEQGAALAIREARTPQAVVRALRQHFR